DPGEQDRAERADAQGVRPERDDDAGPDDRRRGPPGQLGGSECVRDVVARRGQGRGHQLAPENSLRRSTMARAATLTRNVITKSTRPLAMSALTLLPLASAKLRAMLAAIVLGLVLLIR